MDIPMKTLGTTKSEHLYKILVIGELGTGKTSFIKRYVHNFFSTSYRATIGVDFALKAISWDANTIVRLQLWDIAGQERYGNMTRVYYRDALGAFLLFDVTRFDSFKAIDKWKADLDSKVLLPDGRPIPCVLIGNKCDQEPSPNINKFDQLATTYAKDKGFCGYFAVSAKENKNVEESANFLIEQIMDNEKWKNYPTTSCNSQQNGTHNDIDRVDKGGRITIMEEFDDQRKNKDCSCII